MSTDQAGSLKAWSRTCGYYHEHCGYSSSMKALRFCHSEVAPRFHKPAEPAGDATSSGVAWRLRLGLGLDLQPAAWHRSPGIAALPVCLVVIVS